MQCMLIWAENSCTPASPTIPRQQCQRDTGPHTEISGHFTSRKRGQPISCVLRKNKGARGPMAGPGPGDQARVPVEHPAGRTPPQTRSNQREAQSRLRHAPHTAPTMHWAHYHFYKDLHQTASRDKSLHSTSTSNHCYNERQNFFQKAILTIKEKKLFALTAPVFTRRVEVTGTVF